MPLYGKMDDNKKWKKQPITLVLTRIHSFQEYRFQSEIWNFQSEIWTELETQTSTRILEDSLPFPFVNQR